VSEVVAPDPSQGVFLELAGRSRTL
jgi:hypothetical protein